MSVSEDQFPLSSYRLAAKHFRRPFTVAAVKHKVQATWPESEPTSALIVAYMDARLVVDRLNAIIPDKWFDEYEPIDNAHLLCKLTVDGITRRDIGEGSGKALYSDALKRAAVKFGIGVSLYAVPKLVLKGSDVKQIRTKKGKSLAMTTSGEQTARKVYEKWLEDHGSAAFGEPLDHGDIVGAQGDYEAEQVEPVDDVALISPEQLGKINRIIVEKGIGDKLLAMWLIDAGVEDVSNPLAALSLLTAEQAAQIFGKL